MRSIHPADAALIRVLQRTLTSVLLGVGEQLQDSDLALLFEQAHADQHADAPSGPGCAAQVLRDLWSDLGCVAPALAPPAAADRDFLRFQALLQREAGIWIGPVKEALLIRQFKERSRELGLGSLGAYHDRVVEDAAERIRMLDSVCTWMSETYFFRGPRDFQILAERLFPAWRAAADAGRRPRRVRAWSAACSTGEEAYTLAMVLRETFPGWDVEVLGSDLSTRALERAAAGVWPIEKAREIPEPLRATCMREDRERGVLEAVPELRALVRFARVNLAGDDWPPGPFDLVFCRNVLIYFERRAKASVLERLRSRLAPDGLVFLGLN